MGIRFQCHLCNEELHVKSYLAGKRGKCPACGESFRVPPEGEAFSRTADGEIAVRQPKLEAVSVGAKPIGSSVPEKLGDKPRAKSSEKSSPKTTSKASTRPDQKPTEPTSQPATTIATAGWPKAIAEAPKAAWFVRPPSGGQFGPAVGDVFHSWLKENRVGRDALVWREGWPEWQLATVVFPECFPNLVLPSPVAAELPTANVPTTIAAQNSLPSPATALADDVAVQGAAQARPTLMRKKKGRRQQVALIATLGVISVVLIIALIVVLVTQL